MPQGVWSRGAATVLAAVALAALPASAADAARAAEPFSATQAADLRPGLQSSGDRALVLTPGALYRLHPESETWTITTAAEGLPPGRLTGVSITDDELWIMGVGASYSDLRFDDWQRYEPGQGLPGRLVCDIEADDDYAYAATDDGAARFDRYVLEWETLAGPEAENLGAIQDVAVGEDRVWFALERGVAEYRKDAESFSVDTRLGEIEEPRVLALRQTSQHLWAITSAGAARYDKDLETWTSFRPGADLPDARVHQISLTGEDLALATDAGLWWYRAESGIWREDESHDQMPGRAIRAFSLEQDRLWVATERAFAVYDEDDARWLDFTTAVPASPRAVQQMDWVGGVLLLLTPEQIVYGLPQGQENPSVFTYRTRAIELGAAGAAEDAAGWRAGLGSAGLAARAPSGESLTLKGGATLYLENDPPASGSDDGGLGELIHDTRVDVTLSGRLRGDRTITGYYDNTDPDNEAYQLSYRGARDDVLRNVSLGEIEQEMFNSHLITAHGLRGGWARAELGQRSDATRRRLVTADAWAGERRTFPGRAVFYGGSRTVSGSRRDIDHAQGTVFAPPPEWSRETLAGAHLYRDDGRAVTDDANTRHITLAGHDGAWDRLDPLTDYTFGPDARTLILTSPLASGEALALEALSAATPGEIDLTETALRNHYWLALEPIPASLELAITDSTGATAGGDGRSYLELFGIDADGDGLFDPDRFSPLSGYLSFPDSLPFPAEVYADTAQSFYTIQYSYRSRLTIFQLEHRNLVPGSETILLDRERLDPRSDYSLVPSTGLFILYEHVLLDDDSVIEVNYMYEADQDATGDAGLADLAAFAGQLGLAPSDHLFFGANASSWEEAGQIRAGAVDLNARLEWKSSDRFLRVTPEIAFSQVDSSDFAGTAPVTADATTRGRATAIAMQSRYRHLELAASYRNLGADFASLENRRTLLGRLREEAAANARVEIGRYWQATLEWTHQRSDRVATTGATGEGSESALIGTVRFLRSGFPNLALRQGLVTIDTPLGRREKRTSRLELELNPDAARISALGLNRLYLRAFIQRSDRRAEPETPADSSAGDDGGTDEASVAADEHRVTDHGYIRLGGAAGNPLAWNLIFEDRCSYDPDAAGHDLLRDQRFDATLQARPHGACDAYLRWESERLLYRDHQGASQGFTIERRLQANTHLYPGRVWSKLIPLSFRIDLSCLADEQGEPGDRLPSASSLFSSVSSAPQQSQSRSRVCEGRWQIRPWLRLVERWERTDSEEAREGLPAEEMRRKLENRLEIRPRGGLLTLRANNEESTSGPLGQSETLRLHGDWDQVWGGGWLTYLSMQSSWTEQRRARVADRCETIHPQARITLRRPFLRLDASLTLSLTLIRIEDISDLPTEQDRNSRNYGISMACSLQPHRVLSVKLQYGLQHSLPEGPTDGSTDRDWATSHDLDIRLSVRV